MLLELKEEATLEELLNNNFEKTVLYFSAKWCGPCKAIHPKIEEFSNDLENKNRIVFIKIDIDDYEELASICDIESLPTFKIYEKNNLLNTIEGADQNKLFMNLSF